jgi:hypothetical protein
MMFGFTPGIYKLFWRQFLYGKKITKSGNVFFSNPFYWDILAGIVLTYNFFNMNAITIARTGLEDI